MRITRDQDDTGSVANRIAPKLSPVKVGRPLYIQRLIDSILDRGMACADLAEQYWELGDRQRARHYLERSKRFRAMLEILRERWPR